MLTPVAKDVAALLLVLCDPLTAFAGSIREQAKYENAMRQLRQQQQQQQQEGIITTVNDPFADPNSKWKPLRIHELLSHQRYHINAMKVPDASAAHYAWSILLKYCLSIGDVAVKNHRRLNKSAENETDDNADRMVLGMCEAFLLMSEQETIHIEELFDRATVGASEVENTRKQEKQQEHDDSRRRDRDDQNDQNEEQQQQQQHNNSSSRNFTILPQHREIAVCIQQLALCTACILVAYKSRGTLHHIYPLSRALFPRVMKILLSRFPSTEFPGHLSENYKYHERFRDVSLPNQLFIARYYDRAIIVYEMVLMQLFSAQSCQLMPTPFSLLRSNLVEVIGAFARLSKIPGNVMSFPLARQLGLKNYVYQQHFQHPNNINDRFNHHPHHHDVLPPHNQAAFNDDDFFPRVETSLPPPQQTQTTNFLSAISFGQMNNNNLADEFVGGSGGDAFSSMLNRLPSLDTERGSSVSQANNAHYPNNNNMQFKPLPSMIVAGGWREQEQQQHQQNSSSTAAYHQHPTQPYNQQQPVSGSSSSMFDILRNTSIDQDVLNINDDDDDDDWFQADPVQKVISKVIQNSKMTNSFLTPAEQQAPPQQDQPLVAVDDDDWFRQEAPPQQNFIDTSSSSNNGFFQQQTTILDNNNNRASQGFFVNSLRTDLLFLTPEEKKRKQDEMLEEVRRRQVCGSLQMETLLKICSKCYQNSNTVLGTSGNNEMDSTGVVDENAAHQKFERWTRNALRLLSPWSDIIRRLPVPDYMRYLKHQQQKQDAAQPQQPELPKYFNQLPPHQVDNSMEGLYREACEKVNEWLTRWNFPRDSSGDDSYASLSKFYPSFHSLATRIALLASIIADTILEQGSDMISVEEEMQAGDLLDSSSPNYQSVFDALISDSTELAAGSVSSQQHQPAVLNERAKLLKYFFQIETPSQLRAVLLRYAKELIAAQQQDEAREVERVKDHEKRIREMFELQQKLIAEEQELLRRAAASGLGVGGAVGVDGATAGAGESQEGEAHLQVTNAFDKI